MLRELLPLLSLSVCLSAAAFHPLPAPFTEHCIVGEQNKYDPSKAKDVPWFTINLDAAPAERWTEVATIYRQKIRELVGVVKNISFPYFHGKLIMWVDKHMGNWDSRLPQPYRDELKGIAKTTGMPLGEIVLYNIFYEIFTVCTSIVAEDPSGKLFHARNLDFGLFMEWDSKKHTWALTEKLKPLVINLRWTKGGKLLYKSVNFAGFIGIYNGLRPNLFTITANERFNLDGGYIGLIKWLLGIGGGKWMTWASREAMEQDPSFSAVVHRLSTEVLMSPVYFIVGGNKTGQGQIISRGRTTVESVVKMDTNKVNGWYVLETNYDPDKDPLYLDDRRYPGNACMRKLGRNGVSFPGIFNVLSSKTNLNLLTAYTVLMQVNTQKFETYIQSCPDGCWFA